MFHFISNSKYENVLLTMYFEDFYYHLPEFNKVKYYN